jgi:hypothetical protein
MDQNDIATDKGLTVSPSPSRIKSIGDKIKANPKVSAGLGIALVVIFLFYWFQLRPASIRQSCYTEAYQRFPDYDQQYGFNGIYFQCLLKYGLTR